MKKYRHKVKLRDGTIVTFTGKKKEIAELAHWLRLNIDKVKRLTSHNL